MQSRASNATLFSSESGRIECRDHAPYPGSDTWQADRYRPMGPGEQEAFRRSVADILDPDEPLCEVCRGIARRSLNGGTPVSRVR